MTRLYLLAEIYGHDNHSQAADILFDWKTVTEPDCQEANLVRNDIDPVLGRILLGNIVPIYHSHHMFDDVSDCGAVQCQNNELHSGMPWTKMQTLTKKDGKLPTKNTAPPSQVEKAYHPPCALRTDILDYIDDSIGLIDQNGVLLYANEVFSGWQGHSREALYGINVNKAGFDRIKETFGLHLLELRQKGTVTFERSVLTEGGSMRYLEIRSSIIKVGGDEFVLSRGHDITMRKKAEADRNRLMLAYLEQNQIIQNSNLELGEALSLLAVSRDEIKLSKRNTCNVIDESKSAVIIHDERGMILFSNEGACALLGRSKKELIGSRISNLVTREERRQFSITSQAALSKGSYHSESRFDKKDGAIINVDIDSKVLDADSGIIMLSIRDITEVARAREHMQYAQLLASLGEMTAGIAHEVNNPLGSILLYSELLLQNNNDPIQAKDDLKVIHSEAKRAARIMTDLLVYGRDVGTYIRRVNLQNVLNNVVRMRRYQQKVNAIDIAIKRANGPVYVTGSQPQLTRALMNIMMNAEEASRTKDKARIEVNLRQENGWAILAVSDNGPGIPKRNLKKVFHPFFTTKRPGEGPGLGLSVCYGIITAHGGLIHAENNKTGGATLVVELPLWQRRVDVKNSGWSVS